MSKILRIVRLCETSSIPAYATPGSVGLDLSASIEAAIDILPGERVLVSTGIAVALPAGHEGQVRPRSGLAARHGITVLGPGTIDEDYRGEIYALLINHGVRLVTIRPGDRIAQLVVSPIARVQVEEVESLDQTIRDTAGFGSTGGFDANGSTVWP